MEHSLCLPSIGHNKTRKSIYKAKIKCTDQPRSGPVVKALGVECGDP